MNADALVLLTDAQSKRFQSFSAELDRVIGSLVDKVETEQQAASLSELLARGKVATKELDAVRKAAVNPLNTQVKAINDAFRQYSVAFAETERQGKALLLGWQRAERARVEAEEIAHRKRLEEAAVAHGKALERMGASSTSEELGQATSDAVKAGLELAAREYAQPREATRGFRTDTGGTGLRERWVLQGIHDLDAVPRHYWRDPAVVETLTTVLRRHVREGVREIPGCSVGIEEGVAVRVG